jgi:hypothetical protein
LLTSLASLAASRLLLPEFPVRRSVKVAVTPIGSALVASVTLPVKPLHLRLTVTLCALPPRTSVIELGLALLMAMRGEFTVKLKVAATVTSYRAAGRDRTADERSHYHWSKSQEVPSSAPVGQKKHLTKPRNKVLSRGSNLDGRIRLAGKASADVEQWLITAAILTIEGAKEEDASCEDL